MYEKPPINTRAAIVLGVNSDLMQFTLRRTRCAPNMISPTFQIDKNDSKGVNIWDVSILTRIG
jgi:hypothetical protein